MCDSAVERQPRVIAVVNAILRIMGVRSEEHTSELQSQSNLVCRLLLEKKKKNLSTPTTSSHLAYPLRSGHSLNPPSYLRRSLRFTRSRRAVRHHFSSASTAAMLHPTPS